MIAAWPRLDYAKERGVYETVHAYLQLIGKLPTRLLPWENHSWHVALRVVPRGFATRPMPADAGSFTVLLDLRDPAVEVSCFEGGRKRIGLRGQSVSDLRRDMIATLEQLKLPAPLYGGPNEIPDPVAFALDDRVREWNADVAARLHSAFVEADRVFNAFRARFRGKSSPSHLFWGSFDLAVTRFSGREAPQHPGGFPSLPDRVTRDAYSHEVISAGFWPGGGGVEEAAFYAYAYPTPERLASSEILPEAAFWHGDLGEFVLPYDAVTRAARPDEMLDRFLRSTYDAAAKTLDFPAGLTVECAPVGRPPAP